MFCPFCNFQETKVLESRINDDQVRRRRECLNCNNRFTTYEKPILNISVIKKNGSEEKYIFEKVLNSIKKSFSEDNESKIFEISKNIEKKIINHKDKPIKTKIIGKLILQELKKNDKMAYLRYASIHKSIQDIDLMKRELEKL